jgi:hypothetical protein
MHPLRNDFGCIAVIAAILRQCATVAVAYIEINDTDLKIGRTTKNGAGRSIGRFAGGYGGARPYENLTKEM